MSKPNKDNLGNITNIRITKYLPPGVDTSQVFGELNVEMGNLHWFNYDKSNYLEDINKQSKQPKFKDVYATFNFWGESDDKSKQIYLKFKNGLKNENESAQSSFLYQICCPENLFENYVDDMGALHIDFFDAVTGYTIATSKVIVNLYIKRKKKVNDPSSLIEMRNVVYPITLIGDHNVKIGEFDISITSKFKQNNNLNQKMNQSNRDMIDLNEESFDERRPNSLQNIANDNRNYLKDKFAGRLPPDDDEFVNQRPTRDQNHKNQVSKMPANKVQDFGERKQINIDENEESNDNFQNILQRGERLKKHMEDAMGSNAWEKIHGPHIIPKSYVPPFLDNGFEKFKNEKKIDLNDIEDLLEVNLPPQLQEQQKKSNQNQNNEINEPQNKNPQRRQILDMKYVYLKIRNIQIFDEKVLSNIIQKSFSLQVHVPLPDIKENTICHQQILLKNYEIIGYNEFGFNSTSSYNFKLNENTLSKFVESELKFEISDMQIYGEIKMNRLLLADNFNLEESIDLFLHIKDTSKFNQMNKKQSFKVEEEQIVKKQIGSVNFLINLQNEDQEEEAKRTFELKLQKVEEERARQEQERHEMAKKKLQFVMEQATVFGQIYVHIDKMGHDYNIGLRNQEQVRQSIESSLKNKDGLESTFNNRATATEEEIKEGEVSNEKKQDPITHQKRNLFIQFKAFPNFEQIKTGTLWQQRSDQVFNYRAQFPVMMTPESLEKMEKFIFIFELWDQITPSNELFIGLIKVPLAPITYSMKTTDQEIFSLNFMADQFCMYPMIICDGFLPIYSPKQGQNIGDIKITVAMGSPIQVNRLIQKEQDEEQRKMIEDQKIQIIIAQQQKEKDMKEARRLKKEAKKKELEEQKQREEESGGGLKGLLGITSPKNKGSTNKNIAQLLRQSMNSQISHADHDQRERTMLNAMRKLFEDARTHDIEELNGDSLFKDEIKNFDGSVQKDEVMYTFLNNENFSLTRTELAQLMQLMLNINRDDQGRVDIDELHFSFKSYIKYYELIEQRIIDLLEKFKISIMKRIEDEDSVEQLTANIESKSKDSKISLMEFREIIEDRHGVVMRDALYDQFSQFFDLDRDQQIYITSFCEYLKSSSSQKINYFKINKSIISSQIADYVKNSVESSPDCIDKLEQEFKEEIWKNVRLVHQNKRRNDESDEDGENQVEIKQIPSDLLTKEKVNAKLFQFKMKRIGIALSLWEVFTLFEQLNTSKAKMFFEPQRYHHIMFGNFYEFITSRSYERGTISQNRHLRGKSKESIPRSNSRSKQASEQVYDLKQNGYNKFPAAIDPVEYSEKVQDEDEGEGEGYWHVNDESDTEDPRKPYQQVKHIFEIKVQELRNIPVLNKFICQIENQSQNQNSNPQQYFQNADMKKQAHLLLNKYIQNVAVKYSFPLDEDEILESDYLQLNKEALDQQGVYNYNVSMDTVHTYVIDKKDSIKKVLELCQLRGGAVAGSALDNDDHMMNSQHARKEELFNISVAVYQDNRQYIIGNSHLPIEDLMSTIEQHQTKTGAYNRKLRKTHLNRTIFIYGTQYSQRENCIIGKLQLDILYSQEKIFLSKKEAQVYAFQQDQRKQNKDNLDLRLQNPFSCFMHRETYINRKIPLNAKLSILIDRVSNLKESIENIEHFAKIQHSVVENQDEDKEDIRSSFFNHKTSLDQLRSSTFVYNRSETQNLDRRRVLKHILKNGLNLIIKCSVFEEDQELMNKFDVSSQIDEFQQISIKQASDINLPHQNNLSRYQTRMLYNSLNPVFGEVFEMNLQMNTKIFEYLKNKRAVFEIRHYIVESQKQKINKIRQSQSKFKDELNQREQDNELESERTIEDFDVTEQCDYIVLGYVRVPLLQLITKNNGVDGEFSIFDEFKQNMGSLKLRITLNHHNSQRPLYSTSNKIPNQVVPQITQNNAAQTIIEKSIGIGNLLRTGSLSKGQLQKQRMMILGLDFIELIIKNRKNLTTVQVGQTQRFYLKYRIFNQNYQTKFLSTEIGNSMSPLNIILDKINLQKLKIGKSNFIDIDIANQEQMEQAFGKPLQIQLWHKVESLKSYERPLKEEMIGQFFVELNELSKIPNRRLKSQKDQSFGQIGKFQAFEGYFSMHDVNQDMLSSDRLGMRLYLFQKDETNETLTVEDLNQMFNIYRPKIEDQIQAKLDKEGKGYSECQSLVECVKDFISDEYLAQKLIWFIKNSLEFKSVDKVYYSPLFGLPPPFFQYSHKFDQIEIICKINEELQDLDHNDYGFVPVNLFRNCLESEINIKSKIVEDFINGIRDTNIENSNVQSTTKTVKEQQSLDQNLITNSLKSSHVDYIVLLRKLSQFMYQNSAQSVFEQNKEILIKRPNQIFQEQKIEPIFDYNSSPQVVVFFEIDNGMGIKNPITPNESPSVFVQLKPGFQYLEQREDQIIQTVVVKQNRYPTWNYKSKNFTLPLNDFNKKFIQEGGVLKFEVYHKLQSLGSTNMSLQDQNHLIGVVFVQMNGFIEGKGKTRITGLYDVTNIQNIYHQSIQSLTSIKESFDYYSQSLGKIKISITVDKNIKHLIDQEFMSAQFRPISENSEEQNIYVVTKNSVKYDEDKNFSFYDKINPTESAVQSFNKYLDNQYKTSQTIEAIIKSPGKSVRSSISNNFDNNTIKSNHKELFENQIREYDINIQNLSVQEQYQQHKLNMDNLQSLSQNLNRKLNESLANERNQRMISPEVNYRNQQMKSPEINQRKERSFGTATFKTDDQQVSLSQQLDRFRADYLQKTIPTEYNQNIMNPFASHNFGARDILQEEIETQQDFVEDQEVEQNYENQSFNENISRNQNELDERELQESNQTANKRINQIVNYEDGPQLLKQVDLVDSNQHQSRNRSVNFENQSQYEQEEVPSNNFNLKNIDLDDVNFDDEEMKRIQRIFKQQ